MISCRFTLYLIKVGLGKKLQRIKLEVWIILNLVFSQ